MLKTATEVAEQLAIIFNDGPCSLFAGAGVSARAGLPVWTQYLDLLADKTRAYEPLTAELVHKRIQSKLFLDAASLFKTCPEIPDGEKRYARFPSRSQ